MQRSMLKFLKWVLHHIDFNQAGYTGLMMDHCSPDIRNFHTLSDCFTKLNYKNVFCCSFDMKKTILNTIQLV